MEDRIADRMNKIYREKAGLFGEGVRKRRTSKRRTSKRRASSKRGGYGIMDEMMEGGYGTRKGALKGWKTRRSHMRAKSKKSKRSVGSKRGGYGTRTGALKGWISRFSKKGKKIKSNKEVRKTYRSLPKSKSKSKSKKGGFYAGARSRKNPWIQFLHKYRMDIKRQGLDIPSSEIMKMAAQEYRRM